MKGLIQLESGKHFVQLPLENYENGSFEQAENILVTKTFWAPF